MPTRKPAAKATPKKEAAEPTKAKGRTAKPKAEPAKAVAPARKRVAVPVDAAQPEPVPPATKEAKPVQAEPVQVEPKQHEPKPAKRTAASRKTKAAAEQAANDQAGITAAAHPDEPATDGMDPRAWKVLEAIRKGNALEFIFANADANPPRTFEPRMLCYDALSQGWYAWGWDRRYNAERHHRLDLLAEVNAVEGLGRAAQGPFKEGTAPNMIGGWLGGEAIQVKAVLMKQWTFAVKQAPPPFPEFRMEDLEDGKAQVQFTATDLRAIARWCMQFGDGIQVLEPQRLVDRIKQVGITWGGKPRPEAEPPRPAAPPPPPRPAPAQPAPARREVEEKAKAKGPRVEVRIERL